MNKQIEFSKIFYVFLLAGFSLHIFVLDLKIQDSNFVDASNGIYNFYLTLWASMEEFDIIWIIFGILIYYFYYQTYFLEDGINKRKIFLIIISILLSIFLLVVMSICNYNSLDMLFSSATQVYKCLMVGVGYYFIIYAFLKRLFYREKKIECDIYE